MNDVILNQFLACVPVKDISWCYFKYASESQAQLFNKVLNNLFTYIYLIYTYIHSYTQIFNHGVVKAYPPASDYQLTFLKRWMKMVCSNNK